MIPSPCPSARASCFVLPPPSMAASPGGREDGSFWAGVSEWLAGNWAGAAPRRDSKVWHRAGAALLPDQWRGTRAESLIPAPALRAGGMKCKVQYVGPFSPREKDRMRGSDHHGRTMYSEQNHWIPVSPEIAHVFSALPPWPRPASRPPVSPSPWRSRCALTGMTGCLGG